MRKLPGWFSTTETISTIGPDTISAFIPFKTKLIIKVDVEGHEHAVFQALATSGALNSTKAVFYEVNQSWSQEYVLKDLLRQYGFNNFVCTASKCSYDVLATREPLASLV